MTSPAQGQGSFVLIDLWPRDQVSKYQSGFKRELYKVDKHPVGRVQQLIDSWKKAALDHGFGSHAITNLSCTTEKDQHVLTLATNKDRNYSGTLTGLKHGSEGIYQTKNALKQLFLLLILLSRFLDTPYNQHLKGT